MNRYDRENELGQMMDMIQYADDHQISQIVRAVIRRFSVIRPDEEVMFLTLPKNDVEECERVIMSVLNLLKSGESYLDCVTSAADT